MPDSLIQRCKDQERAAQQELYMEHYPRMMSICMRYAGSRDEAGEVLNDGFLKIFSKLDKYDAEKGDFVGWMVRVMTNTAIDYCRKKMRAVRTAEITDWNGGGYEPEILPALGAEELMGLVQRLTPAYRAVFNLYAVDGMTHREIAERLGISEGTSKSNLAKARLRLQAMLSELESEKASYG